MITDVLQVIAGSGGAVATALAAIRTWGRDRKDKSTIVRVRAGDKSFVIDASDMTRERFEEVMWALTEDVEPLISSADGSVLVWDAATGEAVARMAAQGGPVSAVALGRAGSRDLVVSGSADGTVRLWDAATGEAVGRMAAQGGPVSAVALGRAGSRDLVVSGSA